MMFSNGRCCVGKKEDSAYGKRRLGKEWLAALGCSGQWPSQQGRTRSQDSMGHKRAMSGVANASGGGAVWVSRQTGLKRACHVRYAARADQGRRSTISRFPEQQ